MLITASYHWVYIYVIRHIMKTEKFKVDNLKCSGCATTVTNTLSDITGVKSVHVDPAAGTVEAVIHDGVSRDLIAKKLASLGYPEEGKGNILHSAKSYVSCMIGRVSDKSHGKTDAPKA
jgi:copper chaperone